MKVKLLFIFFILSIYTIDAQIKFRKLYGSTGYDNGYSVQQTLNKGYLVGGSTSSFGLGATDMYLLKLDSLGEKVWDKTFGDINIDRGYAAVETPDSGFIFAGYTNNFGAGGYDMYLVRGDSVGNVIWTKTYGGSGWDFAYSAAITSDGGIVLAGLTYSFGNGNADVYVVKTDSMGDTVWTKTYGGPEDDEARSIAQTNDGGYILTGITKSGSDSLGDLYILRLDNLGDTLWTKRYGGNGIDEGNQILQTIDNGFIACGGYEETALGHHVAFILKLDSNGDTTWTRKYGYPNDCIANGICQNPDGSYAWTGKLMITGHYQAALFKLDASGNYSFFTTYGGLIGDNYGEAVNITDPSGYIIVGHTTSYNNGLDDIYVVKADSTGYSSVATDNNATNLNYFSNEHPLRPYPLPANKEVNLIIPLKDFNSETTISIYNLQGMLIKVLNPSRKQILENTIEITLDVQEIGDGFYLFNVESTHSQKIFKIIIAH